MSQNIRPVAFSAGRQGRIANELGSGIAIMSDSSIGLKPVIDEPSNPIPPSNASSSSAELIEKLFSWPRTSVNQSLMKRTSRSSDEPHHVVGSLGSHGSGIGHPVLQFGSWSVRMRLTGGVDGSHREGGTISAPRTLNRSGPPTT